MRRLGIDHGDRRVGIAISDDDGRIAHPRDTLARKDPAQLVAAVVELLRAEAIGEVVVGLPLTLEGREGASARRARRFSEKLEEASGVPAVLWDERMTTIAAERALDEAGLRGKGRRRVVDRVAAALMLQSYLDMLQAREGGGAWRGSLEPNTDEVSALGPEPRRRGGRSSGHGSRGR